MSMSLGLGLGLTHRRGTSLAALIRALFANDETGVWLAPSDSTTLFQDAAGTTPAGIGDPVRLALDKSQGLVLGGEQQGAGVLTVQGTGTGTYNASTGVGKIERIDIESRSGVEFSDLVAGGYYEVDIENGASSTLSLAVRSPFLGSGQISGPIGAGARVKQLVKLAAGSTRFYVTDNGGSGTASITIHSVRELPGNHALAPSDAARPLVVEVDGNIAIRRDLIDDRLDVTLPAITNGKIIIGTTQGVWVDDLNFAGGTFSLGPTTYTGGPAGLYEAIGADELGAIILDRQPTEAELDTVFKWFKSKGAPVNLIAPLVLTSPNGTVFRTAEGRVLVRGTRTVTQEQSSG